VHELPARLLEQLLRNTAARLSARPPQPSHPLPTAATTRLLASFSSIELYSARSRRSVRIMIIATMPLSSSTITSELRMENQCT
tara:strand:+ start:256 stop:507 length:252 start_codon:yes stop_codon:yes gene_type:complete